MADLTEDVFGELYQEAWRPLWGYVYRTTGRATDADDIVQEAFCRVLRAGVGRLTREELRKYLFRIASNLMADRWRRATRERAALERLDPDAVVETPAMPDKELSRTFAKLKPRDRALLWLAYVEELDQRQMAATLGVGIGSVKVLLARARRRLRGLLPPSPAARV